MPTNDTIYTFDVEKNSTKKILVQNICYNEKSVIKSDVNNGTIQINKTAITYTPLDGFTGTDSLMFSSDSNKGSCIIIFFVTEHVFKPRARLLLQLGDQLIRNESIALVELVKNAYDADANKVSIDMKNIDTPEAGVITIEDDGLGMDLDIIKNVWLEPGSDNKANQVKNKILTPRCKRLPIGEKGIGRFGVHKLGMKIELVSRMENKKEVKVNIDWSKFEEYKYLDEAPVSICECDPQYFTGKNTGTKITITNLRDKWTIDKVKSVFRAINAIATPEVIDPDPQMLPFKKESKCSFTPIFNIDNREWVKGLLKWDNVKDLSLFYFDIEIENHIISKFTYKFLPFERMIADGIKKRVISITDKPISKLLNLQDPSEKKSVPITLEGKGIGKIKFSGCIFIREVKLLKLSNSEIANNKSVADYLDQNGGIRVYRDGLRVYDYGEPGNDWLALDYRRFNQPGTRISNNMIIGAVNLDRCDSYELIEKTNREGFIENESYQTFRKAVSYALKQVELLRREDKNRIDLVYSPTAKTEPVLQSINELSSLIDSKVTDKGLKREIKTYVRRIEQSYKFMNQTLIKSANVGLSVGVIIHEIEKIILELDKVLAKEDTSDRILNLVKHLSGLIENYSQVLRKTQRKKENLSIILNQAIFNVEYRLSCHNIEVIPAYSNNCKIYESSIARNLVIGTLMNIIDNSIYWLDRQNLANKKIRMDISDVDEGYISIIISDNGPGFALPLDEITEPFISGKPDGMGLGLHITEEIIKSHGGKITFNQYKKFNIPDEFSKGASVILGFKK